MLAECKARKLKPPLYNVIRFTFITLLGDPDKPDTNLVVYIKGFSGASRQILKRFELEAEIERRDGANRLFEIVKTFAGDDRVRHRSAAQSARDAAGRTGPPPRSHPRHRARLRQADAEGRPTAPEVPAAVVPGGKGGA